MRSEKSFEKLTKFKNYVNFKNGYYIKAIVIKKNKVKT